MKFKHKPTKIEAWQFFKDFTSLSLPGVCARPECVMFGPHLHTIHEGQKVLLEAGDWIIRDADGIHFYPCKPDVFAESYEAC